MRSFDLVLLQRDEVQKKWKNYTREHGIYALTFDPSQCYSWSQISLWNGRTHQDNVKIKDSTSVLCKAVAKGNLIRNSDGFITIIGRFEKNGEKVTFVPETEKYLGDLLR